MKNWKPTKNSKEIRPIFSEKAAIWRKKKLDYM